MKLNKIRSLIKKNKVDGIILHSEDPNFQYYLQKYLMHGFLYIPKSGKPTVFVHRLEELEHEFNVIHIDKDTLKNFLKGKKLAYNQNFLSAHDYRKIKPKVDLSQELEVIRTIKTDEEVKNLKKAAKLADEIMQSLIKNFKFNTEQEIKTFLKTEFAKRNLKQSFEPIVGSGIGASIPHYFGSSKLRPGFLIVDMGVKYKGYCSDITRTFYIGKPTEQHKAIYEKVLDVQKKCIKMCKKGVKCADPYNYAFEQLGHEFSHGLGHGVGLLIHELPNLKGKSEETFQENMVFTIEPGVYNKRKKIGIRIEDDVMIKNGKPVLLTKTTKELISFPIRN